MTDNTRPADLRGPDTAPERIHLVENASGTITHEIYNSKERPVQIVEPLQFHIDANGKVTVDRIVRYQARPSLSSVLRPDGEYVR